MSGKKRTYSYVSDDELRRLRQQAANAVNLKESVRILNQLNSKNEAAISEYRRRIDTMNRNMDRLTTQMNSQSAAAKKEVQQLRTQLQQSVKESNARIQAMAAKNEENIANMQTRFQEDLRQTRTELEETISDNQRRIESVELAIKDTITDQATLLEMAREYARTAEMLLQDLRENYRFELLIPGRMQEVAGQLQTALQDIRDAEKMPENSATSRLTARQAATAALQFHQDVLQAEQEWNLHYQAARQVIDATEAQLEVSRNLDLSDESGQASVDVNYWTNGDLEAIARRVEVLDDCLSNAEDMTIQQIDHVQEAGTQASKEIDDTVMFAAEAFYCSQDRADISADIAENLQENLGLQVTTHSFRGQDQRAAHRIHMKNPVTGFEMVVTQTPEKDDTGRIINHLESDILNYGTCNMEYGDEIARGALGALSGLGFEQTEVQTVAGFEHRQSNRTECANMHAWKQEQNVEVLKPSHGAMKK